MVYDCNQITERLFIGAQINSDDDIAQIKKLGITCIIDAQLERDDRPLATGLSYIWTPVADDGQHPKPVEWFLNAINFGMYHFSKPGAKILTHCAAGVNRGPSLGYALLRCLGWSHDEAFDVIKAHRPQVNIAYREDAELALKQLGWI